METVAATEGWRARRVGRWCSRFLVVLGGAVAGSAVAWAVTTSGAAAATEPADDPVSALTSEIQGHSTDARSTDKAGRSDMADALRERRAVRSISDSAEDAGEAAATVSAAVCDLADRVAERPCQRVAGSVEQVAGESVEQVAGESQEASHVVEHALTPPQEVQDFGKNVWGLLDPRTGADLFERLPEFPGLSGDRSAQPVLPVPGAAAPESADSGAGSRKIFTVEVPSAAQDVIGSAVDVRHSFRHLADAARGAGDDREGNAPVQPVRLPLAPLTAPAAPGGSHGAGHMDGTMFGVSAGSSAASDDTAIRQVRSGARHLQVSPGAQPGVTPD